MRSQPTGSHAPDLKNKQNEEAVVIGGIESGDSKLNDKHRSSSSRRHSDERKSRRSSLEKGTSKKASYRSSSDRPPRNSGGASSRPSHGSNSKRRSSRHKHSSSSRRRLSKESSHRRSDKERGHYSRPSTYRSPLHSNESDEVVDTLYGKDNANDNKEKEKSSRGRSERAVNPGVEHISGKPSTADKDTKEKTKSARRSPKGASEPGVEHFSNSGSLATTTLYGDDDVDAKKAKAKVSRHDSEYTTSVPGVQQVPSDNISTKQSDTISTLYGKNESDAKAKAKASRSSSSEYASYPGADRVFSPSSNSIWEKAKASRQLVTPSTHTSNTKTDSTMTTLYGEDADAKAKARASRGSSEFGTNPGAKTVSLFTESSHSTTSTLYGSDADTKAKAKAFGGNGEYASNPGVQSVHTASNRDLAGSTSDNSVNITLYGNDAGTKNKARAALRSSAHCTNPGVESIARRLTMTSLTDSVGSMMAPDEQGENGFEAPVARRVSIGTTDSESSNSVPEHGMRSEAVDAVRLPNDLEASPRYGETSAKRVVDKTQKSRKKRICFFLLVLLFIGGGVVAWYFLSKNEGSESDDSQISSVNISDPTSAPSSQAVVSLDPIGTPGAENATTSPSGLTPINMVYERPSKSDCIAISLNQTIAGREEMENVDFGLDLEVVVVDDIIITEQLVQELLNAIQEKILPSLAGCNIFLDEVVESWRFVIFDAFVNGNVQREEKCQDGTLSARNCHLIFVELDLFLKGNVKFLDIIRLIGNEEENFSNHLGLSDQFLVVKMIRAESLTPTAAPTTMPSHVPSFTPSTFPTVQASANPTFLPSLSPTRIVSGQPTRSPTLTPSSQPSFVPSTALPSSDPSLSPSKVLSNSPSTRPSETPSSSPSSRPTVDPSVRPTNVPSAAPSVTPSVMASKSPTKSPSASPSGMPTRKPSSAPSTQPTSSPSKEPTRGPSAFPSSLPSVEPTGSYRLSATDRKCPYQHPDRLFKDSAVADIDECYNLCLSTPDCIAFSIGIGRNCGTLNCMGCKSTSTVEFETGFTVFMRWTRVLFHEYQ
ncbi:unnamed protein product [Cylindrotheca closterium]|uniref:Circumsporozoite protein n=1 Tax=Cylindrotheca closterium TaxID=2856 RepID=A0AAD2JNK8_9STRA|nr:unnamed protein product [Cylindrotheca closterium]